MGNRSNLEWRRSFERRYGGPTSVETRERPGSRSRGLRDVHWGTVTDRISNGWVRGVGDSGPKYAVQRREGPGGVTRRKWAFDGRRVYKEEGPSPVSNEGVSGSTWGVTRPQGT